MKSRLDYIARSLSLLCLLLLASCNEQPKDDSTYNFDYTIMPNSAYNCSYEHLSYGDLITGIETTINTGRNIDTTGVPTKSTLVDKTTSEQSLISFEIKTNLYTPLKTKGLGIDTRKVLNAHMPQAADLEMTLLKGMTIDHKILEVTEFQNEHLEQNKLSRFSRRIQSLDAWSFQEGYPLGDMKIGDTYTHEGKRSQVHESIKADSYTLEKVTDGIAHFIAYQKGNDNFIGFLEYNLDDKYYSYYEAAANTGEVVIKKKIEKVK